MVLIQILGLTFGPDLDQIVRKGLASKELKKMAWTCMKKN